jgi:hypothetical protein
MKKQLLFVFCWMLMLTGMKAQENSTFKTGVDRCYYSPSGSMFQTSEIVKQSTGTISIESINSYEFSNAGRSGYRNSQWSTWYGGEFKDECYHAIQTSDGGYALIGRSLSFGAGNFDAWLLKTDASGNKMWEKTFGDSYIDEAYFIRQTSDGGYIIGGMTTSFGDAGEGWLIKTDENGNTEWSQGYHPSNGTISVSWEYIYGIIETADGGFVFAGDCATGPEGTQAWIGKVDQNGELLWDHHYGYEFWERIFALEATSDGGFVGVGDRHWTYDSITWQHDGWLLKFNETGDTTWTKHFGQVEHDIFRNVKQTEDGGFIIVGESEAGMLEGFKGWMVRTDESGNELWNKHFSKGGLWGLQIVEGNYVAAGIFVEPYLAGEGWLINVDASGQVNWESLINGTAMDDMFLSLNPTSDGGLVGAGKYNQFGDECDYWLVKISADGPEALTYFFEDFDAVEQPALPENWSAAVDVMLSNTVAEIRTMPNGISPSQPNAVFIMNGLDGSNGQPDPSAFVALVSPYVQIGNNGAVVSFYAAGTNPIQIGTMTNPDDITTWNLISEIPIVSDFTFYSVEVLTPGLTHIALKHSNQSNVTPIFVDDIEFKQRGGVGVTDVDGNKINIYPNPSNSSITVSCNEIMESVTILSMAGSEILSIKVRNTTLSLNTTLLPKGNYVARIITSSGKVLTKKLVTF